MIEPKLLAEIFGQFACYFFCVKKVCLAENV